MNSRLVGPLILQSALHADPIRGRPAICLGWLRYRHTIEDRTIWKYEGHWSRFSVASYAAKSMDEGRAVTIAIGIRTYESDHNRKELSRGRTFASANGKIDITILTTRLLAIVIGGDGREM
ncbi:hypothetical protein LshimejAT787_0409670 [Lyophyllum shimeji]|uniref:Uncharacterized protein n=1 Tax=Lyophyllum shimeji TaxID=47721 RepID=A0A9P3UP40_LYOSH|nr:hypothetical protein LshimejAT787_0409670 [Lyophyllum shimeji]